jgi:TPR repeat protein
MVGVRPRVGGVSRRSSACRRPPNQPNKGWLLLLAVVAGCHRAAPVVERDAGVAVVQALGSAAPSATPVFEPPDYALKLPARMPAAVAAFVDRCSRGEDAACLDAAAMFLEPRVAPDRPAVAARLLQAACQRNHLPACAELGWLHTEALGVPYDLVQARTLMERACHAGDAHGCARLGEELVFAQHFAQDIGQGMAALEKACDGSDAFGCKALGRAIAEVNGNHNAAKAAQQKAVELSTKSCQAGRYHECRVILSRPIQIGDPLAFQRFLALVCQAGGDCSRVELDNETRLKRCNQGHFASCIDLVNRGGGNTPRAFEWLKQACLAGLSWGCQGLGSRFSRPEQYEVFEQACREGELEACGGYARSDKPARDAKERARYEFACAQHSARHCNLVLHERRDSMDRAEYLRAVEATCPRIRYRVERRDLDAVGCKIAADAYRSGDGVPRDPARAIELYRSACFPGSSPRYRSRVIPACMSAAEMYDRGEGVDPDPVMATALWAGACYAYEQDACAVAAQRVERGIGILPSAEGATRIRKRGGNDQ